MSKKDKLDPCIRCSKLPGENDKYCTDCGAPLQNRCSDEPGLFKKGCRFVNAQDAAYCTKCGEPTMYHLHGLVTPMYDNANKTASGMADNWQKAMKKNLNGIIPRRR